MKIPARYVVLDGPDGCGKSTQAALLAEWWRSRGVMVRHVREPGSTPVAEHLRQLLLDPDTGSLDPTTEALLFSAARLELLRTELHLEIESAQTELFDSGLVDSLAFVDLLFQLEQQFGLTVQLDDIDPDRFRTVEAIAEYVRAHAG